MCTGAFPIVGPSGEACLEKQKTKRRPPARPTHILGAEAGEALFLREPGLLVSPALPQTLPGRAEPCFPLPFPPRWASLPQGHRIPTLPPACLLAGKAQPWRTTLTQAASTTPTPLSLNLTDKSLACNFSLSGDPLEQLLGQGPVLGMARALDGDQESD